jgi:hypothetical protein
LLEIIRYWGGPGPVGMNKTLPREYGLLYNGLVKQNVAFPEPLFLNEPMLAKVMFQPELDAIRNSGLRNSGPNPNNPQLSSSNPFTANPHTQLQHSITEMRRLRTDIAKKVMDSPAHPGRLGFTPDIPPLVMALDGAAKSIRGNPDLMNVEADPNAHALATDIRNELKVNDAIQESFRMGQTTGDISMLQMGVIEAYANTLNRDLFSNPITEPELNAIPNTSPSGSTIWFTTSRSLHWSTGSSASTTATTGHCPTDRHPTTAHFSHSNGSLARTTNPENRHSTATVD